MTQDEQDRSYYESLNYLLGRGVAKDERRSFTLNQKAARAGHADAVLAMGWFYLNGTGVERDVAAAERWYRKAARHGNSKAMFSLGQIAYGQRDFSEAFDWFRRASEAGHPRSFFWQGKLYWRGDGVQIDREMAMKLFHEAASQKVVEAQRALRFLNRKSSRKSEGRRGVVGVVKHFGASPTPIPVPERHTLPFK